LKCRLYNPEIAFGDLSDIKGVLSVAKSLRSTVAKARIKNAHIWVGVLNVQWCKKCFTS
jgi:hypothetical protein